jgi:serine/threonine protein kinase
MKWSLITLIFNFFFSFVIFLAYNSANISEYSRSVALVNATPSTLNITCPPKYEINCRNIHAIRVIDRGTRRGRLRKVDVGFLKERKVAIKRFNDLKPQQVSYEVRQLLFINEILLLDQLSHPSLIKMLGYCVRNGRHKNTLTAPTDLDITAVFEYGEPFSVRNMSVSVEQRLQHSIDLSSLLEYMSNTHLGSLLMADFKAAHFLMVSNSIKLIDFEFFHNVEPFCNATMKCLYNLTCDTSKGRSTTPERDCDPEYGCNSGVCTGSNLKHNIKKMNDDLLYHLLQKTYFPVQLHAMIDEVTRKLNKNDIDVTYLVNTLREILHIYKIINNN